MTDLSTMAVEDFDADVRKEGSWSDAVKVMVSIV